MRWIGPEGTLLDQDRISRNGISRLGPDNHADDFVGRGSAFPVEGKICLRAGSQIGGGRNQEEWDRRPQWKASGLL
jgi:hypothetical protein